MSQQIAGIVRHVLTFGAGFLVSSGVLDPTQVETIVGGLVAVVGVVWSIVAKKKAA